MCAALKFQNLPTYNEPDPHIRVYRVPAREIGFLSASTGLYPRLSVREMLAYFGRLHGMPKNQVAQRTEELVSAFDLFEFIDQRCEGLSSGQRQRASIAPPHSRQGDARRSLPQKGQKWTESPVGRSSLIFLRSTSALNIFQFLRVGMNIEYQSIIFRA